MFVYLWHFMLVCWQLYWLIIQVSILAGGPHIIETMKNTKVE